MIAILWVRQLRSKLIPPQWMNQVLQEHPLGGYSSGFGVFLPQKPLDSKSLVHFCNPLLLKSCVSSSVCSLPEVPPFPRCCLSMGPPAWYRSSINPSLYPPSLSIAPRNSAEVTRPSIYAS